ncbi:MAG: tetratricopeptide repeat protein, partial [Flavobacteriales bacterium]|nr:tetratricopeptide repeat protein [Flavobacteriales bacterium]
AEAELYYEQYESIVPDNNVLFVIIELEGQQGKFEEAIEHLNELVSREPNKGRGYMKLGMAYALQGQEATAATYFLKTTEIAPRNAEAYFNLGLVYINTGRLEEAYEVLNKCLDVDPNHERAINLIKQLQSGS